MKNMDFLRDYIKKFYNYSIINLRLMLSGKMTLETVM